MHPSIFAVGMDDVDHAWLLMPAAEFALLLSQMIESGAYLASLRRADSHHSPLCHTALPRTVY